MLYPLKFKPVYKDYVWGGRGFERLGRTLPEGIVAESWEVSCHRNGVSVVSNGALEGTSLPDAIKLYGRELIGSSLPDRDVEKFPLLVKLIDADKNLSVQVHPGDEYARTHENGEYGKNEMWFIISARPGARLVYDVRPGTTRERFAALVRENRVEECLNTVEVSPGDAVYIPSGLVHAIGQGIMLAEVQQNSDTTYRVYDYGRTDRQLHIEKALEVIDFASAGRRQKYTGLKTDLGGGSSRTFVTACRYFAVEAWDISGQVDLNANGEKFYLYTFFEGSGEISWKNGKEKVTAGESLFIPASLGEYALNGGLKGIRAYIPDIEKDVVAVLKDSGYSYDKIVREVAGLA
jgi:mannose-6-phosphate isomerase